MNQEFTLETQFSCAHRYYSENWSQEKNFATFGACANPVGHGHDYRLKVTFRGSFRQDHILAKKNMDTVRSLLDHQHLNHLVPDFKSKIPTTENLLLFIKDQLESEIKSTGQAIAISRIQLFETAEISAIWSL